MRSTIGSLPQLGLTPTTYLPRALSCAIRTKEVHLQLGSLGQFEVEVTTCIHTVEAVSTVVAKTSPIIITEIDWSPYNMDGTPHKDEQGNEVYPNFGTWATSYTSSFGQEYKYVHDQLGNLSMTLSGTATYLDIDQYLKNRRVTPAFNGMEEACGKACFDWYKDWYEQQYGSGTNGIETIANDADVIQTTYYNMQGMQADKPQRGVYILKQLLNNGKVTSRKVCYTK